MVTAFGTDQDISAQSVTTYAEPVCCPRAFGFRAPFFNFDEYRVDLDSAIARSRSMRSYRLAFRVRNAFNYWYTHLQDRERKDLRGSGQTCRSTRFVKSLGKRCVKLLSNRKKM